MSNKLKIGKNQVDLWQAFPEQLLDSKMIELLKPILSDSELASINACQRKTERTEKMIARIFMRSVLSKYTDVPARQLQFSRSLHGKPEIINQGINLSFNLSHCRNMMVCAVTNGIDVGVDVEKIRYKPSLIQINDFLFNAEEKSDMNSLKGPAQQRRFFDYWTLKESYIKATGSGLTTPLNQIGFVPGKVVAKMKLDTDVNDKKWHSWLWSIGKQHRLALTIDKKEQAPTDIRCFHFLPV